MPFTFFELRVSAFKRRPVIPQLLWMTCFTSVARFSDLSFKNSLPKNTLDLKVFRFITSKSKLTQICSNFHDVSITKLIVGLPPKPCPPIPPLDPLLIALPPPHQEYHIRGCSRLEGSLIGPHIHNVEVDLSEFHFHPIVKAENHLVLCFQSRDDLLLLPLQWI